MRLTFLCAAAATALLLTACGGDEGTDDTPASSTASGSMPHFDGTADIRDALAGTDYGCGNWNDIDEEVASCLMAGDAGIHGVYLSDNPAATAAVTFEQDPATPAVIVGENWLFDCGPGDSLGLDRCVNVAEIVGGTLVQPEEEQSE